MGPRAVDGGAWMEPWLLVVGEGEGWPPGFPRRAREDRTGGESV